MLGVQRIRARATPEWRVETTFTENSNSQGQNHNMVKDACNFAESWSLFLQTGVHSNEAAQWIQMLLTNGMPTREEETEECDKADEDNADAEIPPLAWQPEDMRALLQRSQADDGDNPDPKKRVRMRTKSKHNQALTIVESMWGRPETVPLRFNKQDTGPRHIADASTHVAARNQKTEDENLVCPFSKNRLPNALLHPSDSENMLTTWISQLQCRPERPTEEQLMVLQAIVERITHEAAAEQGATQNNSTTSQPLLDLAHGQPGCGKSRLIAWIREIFEDVLGWRHGVQFVCLAFQNSMAAQISGETIHHWSGIPVVETDGGGPTRDPQKMSTKCQILRWILVDEISMVSAQLLGQLEIVVSKVVRRKNPYRLDANGEIRPFGGINVLLLGDMWQLKPVTGTALFASPSETKGQTAYVGCMIMWKYLRRCWELPGSQRCGNTWYNNVLRQCRDGHLSEESYWYLHGLPTGTPACYSADNLEGTCACLQNLKSVGTARKTRKSSWSSRP